MSELKTIVAAQTKMAEELPLIHTSRCESLASLITASQLSPVPCPIFQESLIYLFYGRPAYRSKKGRHPGESVALCPICFVFKPQTVSKAISRVFATDTGAVSADLFKPFITKDDLKDLELDPNIASARRMVPLFFGTNTDYFYGKAITSLPFPPGSLPFRFHNLLLRKGKASYDDGRSAIEAICRTPVTFRGQLSFVVLPTEFLDDSKIRNVILNDWNCDPYPYNTFDGASPTEYYAVVRQKIEEYMKRTTRIR